MASTALSRIHFAPLTRPQIVSFVLAVLFSLPFSAGLVAIAEAGLILGFYLPSAIIVDVVYDRCRSYRPVRESISQSFTLKLVQLAFAFFDLHIGRAFFCDTASISLHYGRMGGEKVFNQLCEKVDLTWHGKTISGWWVGQPGRALEMAQAKKRAHPSPILFFVSGGGFVMARPAFYLEFLHKLRIALSHSNPQLADLCIYAPEYELVPEHKYPTQAHTIRQAWALMARHPGVDRDRIMIMGDSAGANLALGLRLAIANSHLPQFAEYKDLPLPSHMVLMSPFVEMDVPSVPPKDSSLRRNAPFDFVDPRNIGYFAQLFSGVASPGAKPAGVMSFARRKTALKLAYPAPSFDELSTEPTAADRTQAKMCQEDALLSPGTHAARLIKEASNKARVPTLIVYGLGEVLADQATRLLKALGSEAEDMKGPYTHAWPMMLFYLGRNEAERRKGVMDIAAWLSRE